MHVLCVLEVYLQWNTDEVQPPSSKMYNYAGKS